jgi:hypothetical protein
MIARQRVRPRERPAASWHPTPDLKKIPLARTTITPAQLYAILDREFKQLQPAACGKCRVPLPYWRQPPDDVSANWHIGQPSDCPHGCHLVVAELLTRLWTRFDIEKGLVQ